VLLREAGIPFDLTLVDLRKKTTAKGADFEAIVPKGYVPALRLADGYILTETAIILRWIADSRPEACLAPPHGTFERVRFDEMLHFIGTELHKGFAPFTIMVGASAESKEWAKERLRTRVNSLDEALGDASFFFGDQFTAVDAYAIWARPLRRSHRSSPIRGCGAEGGGTSELRESVRLRRRCAASVLIDDSNRNEDERGKAQKENFVTRLVEGRDGREPDPVQHQQPKGRRKVGEQPILRPSPEAEKAQPRHPRCHRERAPDEFVHDASYSASQSKPTNKHSMAARAAALRAIPRSAVGTTTKSMKRTTLFSANPQKQRQLQNRSRTRCVR
jgi:glutathione S-transferase